MDNIELDKVNYTTNCWGKLSENPNIIHILENNLCEIDWDYLCLNPEAIPLLEKNIDKINWFCLSLNIKAIHILEKNVDKVNWFNLSRNSSAIQLLKVNLINSNLNPNVLKFNKRFFKKRMDIFREELMIKIKHPSRIKKWLEAGMDL